MTYALGEGLQKAVYGLLMSDPALDALVSGAVYDAVPQASPDLFVALGPEQVADRSDKTGQGALHDLRISVVTKREGYLAAKTVAAQVCDTMLGQDLVMVRGRVISVRFLRARALRDEGEGTRRIDLWFRVRLDDDIS
ncbi:MAG: DUF3168 domain-containing protein [Jannaschia sp.]